MWKVHLLLKPRKKTLASFIKENPRTTPTASTTFDPMLHFREAVAAELNSYIYMPSVDHGEDPLKWWKFHKMRTINKLCIRESF